MIKLENFPTSRYKHCYSVGKRMYKQAKKMGFNEAFCRNMFVLGNLHDIGYELDGEVFRHDDVLADCLSDGYRYCNEIRYHSKYQTEFDIFDKIKDYLERF